MSKKLSKLIGLNKFDFDNYANPNSKDRQIILGKARLIPLTKPGNEVSLTSVFLSSLRLITEFRKLVLSDAKLTTSGKIYVYTEVSFPNISKERPDGLLLVVKGGVIKDAALFEMKNGADNLLKDQVEGYMKIAKSLAIPKIITVSNEFVSEPTQSPLGIKSTKSLSLYHFSWTYLLTLAHVLLFDNDTNISDQDQVEIMKEVVDYFESPTSGVRGFSQMKEGWSEVVNIIGAGGRLKSNQKETEEAVASWHQEERDLALSLSQELGVIVDSAQSKYRGNLKARQKADTDELTSKKKLHSTLKIKSAASDIKISALFEKKSIEMYVILKCPTDKKSVKSQISWLKKQLEVCAKKQKETFAKISEQLMIDISIKNSSLNERTRFSRIDSIVDDLKDKDIKEFKIMFVKDFGKSFASKTKFVEELETMLISYYKGVIQHLKKWEPSAPQIIKHVESEDIITQNEVVSEDTTVNLPEIPSEISPEQSAEEDSSKTIISDEGDTEKEVA